MNEQQQSTENAIRAESEEPPPYVVTPAPRQSPFATAISRMNLTQMTLAALVVIFLWQWLDGHRAISDMQQQLAKKIAEMDGVSKANQVLLGQSQDEVRELSAKMVALEARYAEDRKSTRLNSS